MKFHLVLQAMHKDKLYLGGSINIPLSFYTQDITYTGIRSKLRCNITILTIQLLHKNHNLNGAGINGRVGIIYRPENSLRLGLAFHTPSFMSLY